ncbi:MAG: hypothetical protein ACI3ZY_10060 [Parabacteroides sp.]
MVQSRLYKAISRFNGASGNIDNLPTQFEKIAKAAFYSGCFVVNKGEECEYRILIRSIEFYYHEDEGIQDPRKLLKGKENFFYEVGALCPHEFGVDILFDDVEHHSYHASFLIREFEVIEQGRTKIETHPRFLWDYLFGGANMLRDGQFRIEWHDDDPYSDSYLQKSIQAPMKRIFSTKTKEIGDERLWRYTASVI